MAAEVISMHVLLEAEVMSMSCADVMRTLCGVTLRALKSENLWRKLNSGQDLVAKDVVRAAVLGLFASGECSLCFTRFCPGFSTFI